ncbi:aminoglycoside phosphotransferase [Beutenbergia cavernae DSM 12333]|uniref:Aminoglycoside phosphotransferase n=1 Tax=Beutenbergia cavernae (strain ATCC BAA-8 / DSM 12333 / CCUG 43141 / JCM 11478 / NBRC 16432 / NCIMB 13614 / HKI 0122) TaxID=471853 RepID=C5C557_BEUC1|nr:aminoglycoside phosphotransferase family protein [Beutenbergia cavernae]ACQ82197.1 aminoglycoside phosphotransferase [Beutenbergia cavernae DSM 12333]
MSEPETPRVAVVGDVVHRPAQAWTPTVHALLRHLRASGIAGVPEPLGIDGDVETVRLLPGDAGPACWPHQASERGLASAARLLRRVHDVSRGWQPPAGAGWAHPPAASTDGQTHVICHGDPGPWNMTWADGEATGLFDWDLAYPGPPLDDVAYALEYFAPFRDDAEAVRWHGFAAPPDRRRRISVFARAYGLTSTDGLVDAVIARQEATIAYAASLAERGIEPQVTWVGGGHLDVLAARVAWSRANRGLVE